MFRYLFKKVHFLINSFNNHEVSFQEASKNKLSSNLKQNISNLRNILGTSNDIIIREFNFGYQGKISAAILFLEGMTDKTTINESIMHPLMHDSRISELDETLITSNKTIQKVLNTMLSVGDAKQIKTIDEVVDGCLSGDTILLINGSQEALVISTKGWDSRGIQEPKTEAVVRGPREGFTETLRSNTTLIRRRLRNPNFTLEEMTIGQKTKTIVTIAYIKGVANPKLVEEVKRRLKRINTDAILESGYIEEFISDAPFSPFSTIANSEKPDIIAAKILEGRVAILVDGTPIVLSVPMVFIESFQSAEDYYSRPYYASLIRTLRFIAFAITILAPGAYVALQTYHHEFIPLPLLITMAAAREGTPFPAVVEALLMGVIFEVLREAGIRLPRPVGSAISIVGALVIGEAAVSAGLIGAPMVIVVALTAIASFVVPAQADVTTMLRLVITIFSGYLGAFGILIVLLGVLIHLSALRSFGVPYLSPIAPMSPGDLKDVFVRVPMWAMLTRPRAISWHDPQRQEFRLMPHPPSKGSKNEKEGK